MPDRLYRSRDDRMLAGVAGGLAEVWGADPSLVRVIWALLIILTGGIAFVVYIVMAIVVPEEDDLYAPRTPAATATAPPGAYAPEGSKALADSPEAAQAARAEARAARRAARADRGGGMSPGLLFGGFLVLLGLFFLVREYLPQIDFDWFWPLVLVGLGIVLVVSAMGGRPRSGGGSG
jgi:phage shock protein C